MNSTLSCFVVTEFPNEERPTGVSTFTFSLLTISILCLVQADQQILTGFLENTDRKR